MAGLSAPLPPRSTDAELDAFDAVCARLSGFGDPVDPEFADGFLTALVCGPVRPAAGRWLEALAGDAFARAFADPPDAAQAQGALDARIAAIARALDPDALARWPDHLRLDPLIAEVNDEDRARFAADAGISPEDAAWLRTGAIWAEGFLAASEAFAAAWGREQLDEAARAEHLDLVAQIGALRLPPGSDEEREFAARYHPQGLPARDVLLDEALFAVQDLRLWWLDHGPRPETRQVAAAPGRNDPCPCGSGRKFKKCHGATT
jgi:uncharacterized protein